MSLVAFPKLHNARGLLIWALLLPPRLGVAAGALAASVVNRLDGGQVGMAVELYHYDIGFDLVTHTLKMDSDNMIKKLFNIQKLKI